MRHASSPDMATRLNATIHNYPEAIAAVLGALGKNLNPRKCLWCNYPIFEQDFELQQKAEKDYAKLEKKGGSELPPTLWYVGIPKFKLTRRGIPSLHCSIDLYYAASGTPSFFGKLIPQASSFEVPVSLILPLADALPRGQMEVPSATIVETAAGYVTYSYLGKEWRLPEAFLGFIWALRERNQDFQGLLDPVTNSLVERLLEELPEPVTPDVGKYEDLVNALINLGFPKREAEETSRNTIQIYPNVTLEELIKYALNV